MKSCSVGPCVFYRRVMQAMNAYTELRARVEKAFMPVWRLFVIKNPRVPAQTARHTALQMKKHWIARAAAREEAGYFFFRAAGLRAGAGFVPVQPCRSFLSTLKTTMKGLGV